MRKRIDVNEVMKLKEKGWTIKDIAKRFGVTRQAIYRRLRETKREELAIKLVIELPGSTTKKQLAELIDNIVRVTKKARIELWCYKI